MDTVPPDDSHEGKKSEPSLEGTGALDFSGRRILSLALPALGALIIEPLLVLIDSIMVGHLGTADLAGLSLASTVLMTLVGVFVFLAYSTTAVTARALGSGDRGAGIRGGIEAMWLASGLGVLLVIVLFAAAPWIVNALGADPQVAPAAITYLRAGSFGMVGMLVILAASGTLRGLLDMRTPLYVLAAGAVLNVLLNLLLIFGLNLGILGAGIGLSIAQNLMAAALVWRVVAGAREHAVPLKPSKVGALASARDGIPLFIRTLSLRAALLATVAVATGAGTLSLAGHQVVNSIWGVSAFALDALAIAAQGLVGVAIGAGQRHLVQALVTRLTLWGIAAAVGLGLIVAGLSKWLPVLFGTSTDMHLVASRALLIAGLLIPISGVVFVLDGVLIGASEGPYLAKLGVVTLVLYLPALGALHYWISTNAPLDVGGQATALAWLWVAFAGWFMALRALANAARAFSPKLGEAKTAPIHTQR